jgi:hypothetical protein
MGLLGHRSTGFRDDDPEAFLAPYARLVRSAPEGAILDA